MKDLRSPRTHAVVIGLCSDVVPVTVVHTPRPGRVLFIGLNPSTADEYEDDPTCTRERRYVERWGYTAHGVAGATFDASHRHRFWLWRGNYDKANLFSLRSTEPRGLLYDPEPSPPQNDAAIQQMARIASIVICAWGGPYQPRALRELVATRARRVEWMLREAGVKLHALAFTKDQIPRHPLYLRGDLEPVRWER